MTQVVNPDLPLGPRSDSPPEAPPSGCENWTFALLVITMIGCTLAAAIGVSALGIHLQWWQVGFEISKPFSIGLIGSGGSAALTGLILLITKRCWYPQLKQSEQKPIDPLPQQPIATFKRGMIKKWTASLRDWAIKGPPDELPNRQICANIILGCFNDAHTVLSLKDCKLTSLPPEIWELTQLESLDLSGNQLTSIPPEMARLSQLRKINLSGNQLQAFPIAATRQLDNLSELDLNNNQLTSLPPDIVKMSNELTISLKGNPLSYHVCQALCRAQPFAYAGPKIVVDNRKQEEKWYRNCVLELGLNVGALSQIGNDFGYWLVEIFTLGIQSKHTDLKQLINTTINRALEDTSFKTTFDVRCSWALQDPSEKEQRVALLLFYMEIAHALRESKDLVQVEQLCFHLIALDNIGKMATKKGQTLPFTDPIEVYLTYAMRLKECLQLPISTLAFNCAEVTSEDIEQAKIDLKSTPEKLSQALSAHPMWRMKQGELNPKALESALPATQLNQQPPQGGPGTTKPTQQPKPQSPGHTATAHTPQKTLQRGAPRANEPPPKGPPKAPAVTGSPQAHVPDGQPKPTTKPGKYPGFNLLQFLKKDPPKKDLTK